MVTSIFFTISTIMDFNKFVVKVAKYNREYSYLGLVFSLARVSIIYYDE
jgi:hypothetical protein